MKKSAGERFADAAEMRTALEQLLVPPELVTPVIAPKRRSFGRTFATAAMATATLGSLAFFLSNGGARGLDGLTSRAVATVTQLRERSGAPDAASASASSVAVVVTPVTGDTPDDTDRTTLTAATAPAAPSTATTPATASAVAATAAPAPAHTDELVAVTTHAAQEARESRGAPGSHPRADDDKLEAARTFAKAHPKDPHGLRLWAIAAEHAGERAEARRAAEAWSKAEPTSEPRLFLATLLDESGRHTEAREVLEDWLDDHPESTDARRLYNRLGGSVGAATVSAHSRR